MFLDCFRRQLGWSPRKAQAPGWRLVAPADSGRLLGKDVTVQAPLTSPSHVRGARLVGKERVLHFRDQELERRPESCSKAISPPGVCVSRSVVSNSCDPMDCSPLGSSVHGILQAKILEWVAISFSRGSS